MTRLATVTAVQCMSSEEDFSDIDSDRVKEEQLSDDEDTEDVEIKTEFTEEGNVGMAAVMAKILGKSVPAHTSTIMSKSVSEKQLAARKKRHLENADPAGDMEVVKIEPGDIKSEPDQSQTSRVKSLKKRKLNQTAASIQLKQEREELCHTLPDALNRNREHNLIKIATRGVVQLFNAVKQQQGKIKEKVGEVKTSIRKTDKVISEFTSGDFLDRLKAQKVKTVAGSESDVKTEIKEEPTWSALRDDFAMGAQSMKDWDKGESEEDAMEGESSGEDPDTDSEGG